MSTLKSYTFYLSNDILYVTNTTDLPLGAPDS